jgi:3'-phosphoadenosine 5'-phosphosulfate sulfotransferase (PAPS reductase)/FAD synthetase
MQRIINFSGGKTSAYMTINEYRQGDLVIFCDTGREHAKTYKFINDFEANENIPVIRLQYEGGFRELLKKKKAMQ